MCLQSLKLERAIDLAYRDGEAVLIGPMDNWILALNAFAATTRTDFSILESLSSQFGEAQCFGSHRVSDFFAWARAVGGSLQRAVVNADGWYEFGEQTSIERSLREAGQADEKSGANNEDSLGWWPVNEDDVIAIAREWSVDPSALGRRNQIRPVQAWHLCFD